MNPWHKLWIFILLALPLFTTQGLYAQQESSSSEPPKLEKGHPTELVIRKPPPKNFVINSAAFSPDSYYIISGIGDKTLRLWEVGTGKQFRVFTGHTKGVTSVAFSPDGRYVISGSWDETLRLWEVKTTKLVHVFTGHRGVVTSVAFSPDGRYVISGSWDGTLRLWEVETGNQVRVFTGHTKEVWSVAFSLDGNYVLSGGDDNTLRLWEVETGNQVSVFTGHTKEVWSVAFSPDGRYVLSGSDDKTLRLWEVETGNQVHVFTGPDPVPSVAFSPDGLHVLSGSWDGKLFRMWEVETAEMVHVFIGHTGFVTSVAFSPDGRYVLSGSWDETLRLWEVHSRKELARFIALEQNNWIVATPEGYYDNSIDAERYISWRFDNQLYSVESFKKRFHRPDLVAATLRGTLNAFPKTTLQKIPEPIRSEEVIIHYTGEDAKTLSEELQYSWRLDDGEWTTFSKETKAQLRGLTKGTHVFEVRTQDADGNIEPTPARAFLRVLEQPQSPTIQILNPPQREITTSDYTFTFAGSDVQTEALKLQYAWRVDGEAWSDYSPNTKVHLTQLSQGFHLFQVRVKDVDGHVASAETAFTVAKQFPEIEILNAPTSEITNSNYTFQFHGSDLQTSSEQLQYSWRLDIGKWSEFSRETSAQLSQLGSGTHLFQVRVKDADGRVAFAETTFTVAKQFPDTKILNAPTDKIDSSNCTFQFRGSDLQTPTEQLQYSWRLDGGEWSGFSNKTSPQLLQLNNGKHLFRVRSQDTDGHIDPAPAEAIFIVAIPEPPETEIITVPDGPIKFNHYINSYNFEFRSRGGLQPIRYSWRLDGKKWSEYSTTPIAMVENLTNGQHTLEAGAMDDSGHVDGTPALLFFEVKIVDEQAPQVFIDDFPAPIRSETYTFTLLGKDLQSDETDLQYSWKLDMGNWTPFRHNQSAVVEDLTDGAHILYARCKDPDRNISLEKAVSFNVKVDIPTIKDLVPYLGVLKKNKFTLTLKGWDLQTPSEQLEYSYQLDEEDWSDYSKESTISLHDLKQDEYVLSVKVRDTDGYESQDYKVNFSVVIPFYRLPLFFGVVGGIAIIGLIVLATIQVKLYQRRQYALKTKYNPYTPGVPVMEESRFFGRTTLLQEIKASIHNASFIIMGDNRIGKTSFLHKLAVEFKTMRTKEYLYLPFYIDISDVAEEGELFEKLLIETKRQVAEYSLWLDFDAILKGEDDNFYRFQDAIGAILGEFEEGGTEGRQIRLIFMLDECDVLNDLGLKVKSRIRSIFTQRYAQNISAILTGVSIHLDFEERESPWWNPFKRKLMNPFTDEEVRTLIKEPADNIYHFEDKAIDAIINWSERNPYLVQLLCHEAVNMAISDGRLTITEDDIQTVISRSEKEKKAIRKAPTEKERWTNG